MGPAVRSYFDMDFFSLHSILTVKRNVILSFCVEDEEVKSPLRRSRADTNALNIRIKYISFGLYNDGYLVPYLSGRKVSKCAKRWEFKKGKI